MKKTSVEQTITVLNINFFFFLFYFTYIKVKYLFFKAYPCCNHIPTEGPSGHIRMFFRHGFFVFWRICIPQCFLPKRAVMWGFPFFHRRTGMF